MKFSSLVLIICTFAAEEIVINGEKVRENVVLLKKEKVKEKTKKSTKNTCSCDNFESRIAALERKDLAQQIEIGNLQTALKTLQDNAATKVELATKADTTAVQTLQTKMTCIDGKSDADDLIFSGCNVHVVNGQGGTATMNGKGNLIVGYDEISDPLGSFPDRNPDTDRAGSHNFVVGPGHAYKSYGGIAGGATNEISGMYSSVCGGSRNKATGDYSSISGGAINVASGMESSVSGGSVNKASGERSSVSGGFNNAAEESKSSISGGSQNTAKGISSSISGGIGNLANGELSSISGGQDVTCDPSYGLCPPSA